MVSRMNPAMSLSRTPGRVRLTTSQKAASTIEMEVSMRSTSSSVLILEASSRVCWPSTTWMPSASSARIISTSARSIPTGSSCTPNSVRWSLTIFANFFAFSMPTAVGNAPRHVPMEGQQRRDAVLLHLFVGLADPVRAQLVVVDADLAVLGHQAQGHATASSRMRTFRRSRGRR